MPATLRIGSSAVRAALLAVALAMGPKFAAAQATNAACAEQLDRDLMTMADGGAHPLLGRMLVFERSKTLSGSSTTAEPAAATGAAVLAAANWTSADFILLGEVHDNPTHHALRAALIKAWRCTEPQRTGAAVFEHIRADQTQAIAGPSAPPDQAAATLIERLEWSKSGWPDGSMFRPLFAATYAVRLAILSGEPPQGRVRTVAREGLKTLASDDVVRLGLDRPLEQPLADALAAELKASHCGMLPDQAVPALALSQRYRDAYQARAMADAYRSAATVFLFAGNGHVRTDRGVPWHLAAMRPDLRAVTVTLVEVQDERSDPNSYVPRDPAGGPAADIVIFTPRATRSDPCAQMKAPQPKAEPPRL